MVRSWSGLGYNRRALNLHRAAAAVVAEHGGMVPHEEAALRVLPALGGSRPWWCGPSRSGTTWPRSTPTACPFLARGVAGTPLTLREAMALGDRLVPAGESWEFNQAMFDLGATVCTAARPDLRPGPVSSQCVWRRQGEEAEGADPWRLSPTAMQPQSTFAGSDRQGRGLLLDVPRRGGVRRSGLAGACGWPADPARAQQVAGAVVTEGFAAWSDGKNPVLRLR